MHTISDASRVVVGLDSYPKDNIDCNQVKTLLEIILSSTLIERLEAQAPLLGTSGNCLPKPQSMLTTSF